MLTNHTQLITVVGCTMSANWPCKWEHFTMCIYSSTTSYAGNGNWSLLPLTNDCWRWVLLLFSFPIPNQYNVNRRGSIPQARIGYTPSTTLHQWLIHNYHTMHVRLSLGLHWLQLKKCKLDVTGIPTHSRYATVSATDTTYQYQLLRVLSVPYHLVTSGHATS